MLEGETAKKTSRREPALLETACDWRVTVDLPGLQYKFPLHVAITEERPDLVLWSESLKLIILVELTVPAERNVRSANAKKKYKYGQPGGLCDEIRARGWQVELLCVEVGVIGFIADTTRTALKRLGVWSKAVETLLSETALRCSYVIFVQHKSPVWTPWRMVSNLASQL